MDMASSDLPIFIKTSAMLPNALNRAAPCFITWVNAEMKTLMNACMPKEILNKSYTLMVKLCIVL